MKKTGWTLQLPYSLRKWLNRRELTRPSIYVDKWYIVKSSIPLLCCSTLENAAISKHKELFCSLLTSFRYFPWSFSHLTEQADSWCEVMFLNYPRATSNNLKVLHLTLLCGMDTRPELVMRGNWIHNLNTHRHRGPFCAIFFCFLRGKKCANQAIYYFWHISRWPVNPGTFMAEWFELGSPRSWPIWLLHNAVLLSLMHDRQECPLHHHIRRTMSWLRIVNRFGLAVAAN